MGISADRIPHTPVSNSCRLLTGTQQSRIDAKYDITEDKMLLVEVSFE